MKKQLLCGASLLLGCFGAVTSAEAADCASLLTLNLPGVEINSATAQESQVLPPDTNSAMTGASPREIEVGAHCLVEGTIGAREGVNGPYATRFQMRMPDDWNGRFLFQGGGGMDGFIAPAVGMVPSVGSTATPAIVRGYAVVSMNGGHDGPTGDFGFDQQARVDFAYASIGKVTNVAKVLISGFYEKAADKSFFMGCSNGGREAMIAAQRYPEEFDGVVVGNPGFHLSAAAMTQAWDVEKLMAIAPEGILSQALTMEDMGAVAGAIVAKCDAADGIEDGIVAAPSKCDFDLESMRGQLSDEKIDALAAVMQGPIGANGEMLYSDWPYDPGMASPGWRVWKLGFSPTQQSDALNMIIGPQSLPKLFMTPPQPDMPNGIDYDALAENVSHVGGYFDATMTPMSTFAHNGGKMIIFQGMADPVFSANDIERWYKEATSQTEGDFARLFMVPGMNHCGGGPAFDNFDPLTALEGWVEKDEAPASLVATGQSFPDRSMPICAYPQEAHYTGEDPNSADSYTCQ